MRRHYGVTDGRYKLMHFYEDDVDHWELYDLETDPKELKSVFDDPSYAATRERLEGELARLRAELEVPLEDPDESLVKNPPIRVRTPLP